MENFGRKQGVKRRGEKKKVNEKRRSEMVWAWPGR